MLRRIGIWPRKSWHGQAASCSHIMQLEATHGIISRCFRPIAATAKLRAELGFACLENVKQRKASKMELEDPEVSAPQGDTSAGRAGEVRMQAEEVARFAEENRVRASDVMEFVLSPNALCRMFCTRIVLEPFRIVKSNMLFRDGEAWAENEGLGRYRAAQAHNGKDILSALAMITELVHTRWAVCDGLAASQPSTSYRHDDGLRFWLMSRAGAALYNCPPAKYRLLCIALLYHLERRATAQ